MTDSDIEAIAAWLVECGLSGVAETELLDGFCARCNSAGLPLVRALTIIDTLHPIYEGRAFRWRNDGVEESAMIEYGRTNEGEAAAEWQRSVFFHLLDSGATELRRRLTEDDRGDFSHLTRMKADGLTDYVAFIHRFTGDGAIGDMDCLYSHWTTAHPDGFADAGLGALRRLLPALALAIKCASLARIAGTLVQVYLGRDAGQRVLNGRIARGVSDKINAVLWFSDLRGYTTITDTAAPDQIIPLLNDYGDAVISAIHEAGGDVLKLIGDGVLAIFKADDPADACRAALQAEADMRRRLRDLNERRRAEGRPVTQVYLGLHIGDVLYGNVGSNDRLDFTVVGPAVNEVSRIASMCRSVDRGVVLSSDFAAATPDPEREHLVSVGRYALRGVGRAQELFTLDPGLLPR
ncbi:MAG: adenylate/guanylate cyclase domain-containing protein [Ferrovibrionaceae bacterium]